MSEVVAFLKRFADPDTNNTGDRPREVPEPPRHQRTNLASLPSVGRLSVGCDSLNVPLPKSLLGRFKKTKAVDELCFCKYRLFRGFSATNCGFNVTHYTDICIGADPHCRGPEGFLIKFLPSYFHDTNPAHTDAVEQKQNKLGKARLGQARPT